MSQENSTIEDDIAPEIDAIEEEVNTDAESIPEEAPVGPQFAEGQSPVGPQLTVNDLKTMVRVIQVGANRGAYNAEELEPVGVLYKNIVNFLASTGHITIQDSATMDPNTSDVPSEAPSAEMMPEEVEGSSPVINEAESTVEKED